MQDKPKIGVLFITSGWFRDVGLQTSSADVTKEIDAIAEEIARRLSTFCEVVWDGVLYSEERAARAADRIRRANVDGLLITPLMWCEDQILRAALKLLDGFPALVCLFLPYDSLPEFVGYQEMIQGSGLVGILQLSGFLKREEHLYKSVTGYYRDDSLYDTLKKHIAAFALRRLLKNAICGVLPFRCDQMSTTYVDEFTLRKRYGVELKYLELQRLRDMAERVSSDDIAVFTRLLVQEGYSVEVDEKNLTQGIRYALAMEKIISEEGIDILAMNDIIEEMHTCFGLRPCLSNPRISDAGVVVTMEADIAAGVCMYVLQQYTGQAPFYAELYTADLEKNAFLMGHPGYHSTLMHDENHPMHIVSDIEYENTDPFTGAASFFKYRSGPVTAVNSVYNGERLRWTVFEGSSLEGRPKMEGTPHLFCRVETPVPTLCSRAVRIGVSQHWIVVPGHIKRDLESICAWLDIEYVDVETSDE
jgi:L-fucose isomerase-like protein